MNLEALEKKYQNFYVPAYVLVVDNKNVVNEGVEVVSLSVDNTLDGADHFTFTVNNITDFAGSEGNRELKWLDDLFVVGKTVDVSIGYVDNVKPMLYGLITSVKVRFPSGGMPQLDVSGYDMSFKMQKETKPRTNNDATDSEFVSAIAADYQLRTSTVEKTDVRHPYIAKTDKESDFDFVGRLAKRNGFEFMVHGKDMRFRKPSDDKSEIVTLVWGRGLLSFSPELNIAQQVTDVEVRGWDFKGKKEIIGKARAGDEQGRDGGRKSGGELIKGVAVDKVVHREHRPVVSQEEADTMARAILNKLAEGLLKGSGECIGIPDIVAGENIRLEGLGKFSKTYYIEKTGHSISGSGYRTTFNVKEKTI